jgi:hypothetical protein
MSILISDGINELQQETKTDGERLGEADFLLAFKRANQYLNSTYKMPMTEREVNLIIEPDVYEYDLPTDFVGLIDITLGLGVQNQKVTHVSETELLHDWNGVKTSFKFDRDAQTLYVKIPGISENTTYILHYYSNQNVKDENDEYKQHPTSTQDTILCPSDADNALIYKAMEWCAVQVLKDASLAQYAARELLNYESLLKAKYPSQEKQTQSYYYRRFK